jgi:1,4-alpha-glucan branching enzyme
MHMTNIPDVPCLYYSTWGSDFYSEHWLKPVNCWMFAMVKFVEANIDLSSDQNATRAFEEFAGSDLMFIYPDPSQRQRVHGLFIQQFKEVEKKLKFKKREMVCTYPVDPFKTLFVYVTMDKPETKPSFLIDQISSNGISKIHQVSLEPEMLDESGLSIYYQFFIVPPHANFVFSVENTSCATEFTSPEFGIPLYVTHQLKVRPKYNQASLLEKIQSIWGQQKEQIPLIKNQTKYSQSLYRKDELDDLLRGKRVAVFKYNKEFYSLLRFQELASYELQVVFDDKVTIEDASEYAHVDAKKIPVVSNPAEIDSYDFDAIILTCAINYESEVEILKKLMQHAARRRIPVLSLYDDALQYDVFDGETIDDILFYRIGLPQQSEIPEKIVDPQETPRNILAVFGTDTVQGKFTTQLYLREALKRYMRIAHWATEPTGCLLGAEIGYSRTDESMTVKDRLAFERASIEELSGKFDLVITGGQNSIVFAAQGGSKEDNVSTLIFDTLLPRYVVLTVSVDTAIKQIEDSIAYVAELAAKYQIATRVIALAMMGGRKIRGSRWTETYFAPVDAATVVTAREKLQDAFGLPLYLIPSEVDGLAKQIAMIDLANA